jgi:hypothetical protein
VVGAEEVGRAALAVSSPEQDAVAKSAMATPTQHARFFEAGMTDPSFGHGGPNDEECD